MKIFIKQFFNPRALQTYNFLIISTFFRPSVSKVLDEILCFILGREFCHKNFFRIFGNFSTITFGT